MSLARALAFHQKTLLLDEPFSNLDANLQQKIRLEMKEIIKSSGVTAIFVSHNIEGILTLSDYILEFQASDLTSFYPNKTPC